MSRLDISKWIVHFVHGRDPALDPRMVLSIGGEPSPGFFQTDPKLNARFEHWDWMDDEHLVEPDAAAFTVILKILQDGHIRSGWSFRGQPPRATIYGPRAACCFSEMPLYALLDYARSRGSKDRVDTYGFAFLKDEFFAAGGRPVIYGLSADHIEIGDRSWPRFLAPRCGIGDDEQYRYVAMRSGSGRRIDWSHEREWRWADVHDSHGVPGLPLWLKDEPAYFTKIALFVPSKEEALRVRDQLKHLYDRGGNEHDMEFRKDVIRSVTVFSIHEALSHLSTSAAQVVRIEDVPSAAVVGFDVPLPSEQTKVAVRAALEEARFAARTAVGQFDKEAPRDKEGQIIGPFGFASLLLMSPQSEVAQALLELDEARPRKDGYAIRSIHGKSGLIDEAEAAENAARIVMERHFPDLTWIVSSRLD